MKTEHQAATRRYLLLLLLGHVLVPMITGCGGYNSNGTGGGNAPYITTQPASQAVTLGQTAMFSVVATGTAPLSYQWHKNGANISGATSSSYTTPATTIADSGSTFDVVVSNSVGTVTSNPATLTVTSSATSTGWTWVQDAPLVFCSGANKSGCTITIGNLTPTVAGSVWVLQIQAPNNVTITSVCNGTNLKGPGNPSGCSGTNGGWTHCPHCAVFNPSKYSTDAWYTLSGPAGTVQDITFTLSGNAGAFLGGNFIEILPPAGTTASYDDSGSSFQTNCTTCTAVTLNNITATDAIIRNDGGAAPVAWNSWSAPYITDSNGFAIGLNVTSGAGPTVTYTKVSNPEYMAIAFKSSIGTFTPTALNFSIVNFTASSNSCTPSCSITIPATGSGHLLYLEAGDESFTHITSVSGGGTWVVPMGSNTCQAQLNVQNQSNALSCAYVLSSTSAVTSISVTMSGSAATNFAVWEVAAASGVFTLDAQGSTLNTTASGFYFSGQPLTLSGSNDVIFQSSWDVGGSLGPNYYAQPYLNNVGSVGPFNYFLLNEAASVVLLDSGPSPPTLTWINAVPNQNTFVSGVAFTTTGGSAAPNPPTGLTAVVH